MRKVPTAKKPLNTNVFLMISWFARFKNRFVKLEKIIKQKSRKNNAEIIDKSSKKASKMEPKSTKNQSTIRAQKIINFRKSRVADFIPLGGPN